MYVTDKCAEGETDERADGQDKERYEFRTRRTNGRYDDDVNACEESRDLGGLFQLGDNHALHAVGRRLGAGPVNRNSLTVDQELCVIPLDRTGEPSTLDSLHVFVERMGIIAVDVDFAVHVKGVPVLFLHSLLDLRIGARFLARKLVARECCDTESVSLIFFVQSLKLMVVGVGQTSVGGDIHNNYDFPGVFFSELDESSVDVIGFELVDGRCQSRVRLLCPDHSQVEQERRHQTVHHVC